MSILFLFICGMFGCNDEAYYFYLTDDNYTIYAEENISINDLKINTNLPKINNYQFNSNSYKIKIENNIIYALQEGSVEININVEFNNKNYSHTFTLNIKPKIEENIDASYYILEVDETKNCFILILHKFYDNDKILAMDIFKEDGCISYQRIGLKLDIFYYKDSSFEKEISNFVLENNITEIIE
ncbi:MAG: hypothetical protein IJW32_02205 [Clostridia bacterium]|nr:hypothetical protein [Clostridia bacterium]